MPHFVEALQREAADAVAAMREAALRARHAHARAELMRHMLTTARKVKDEPRAAAVETVVREWMDAWNLGRDDWPQIAREMTAFTEAFHDYANAPGDAQDAALRAACAALDAVLAREGTSISDEMAFRSQCAHGWWELVKPVPAGLPGRKPRPSVPQLEAGKPFWEAGCADFCR
ncbi:hypothetical protein [Bosea sp. (in: a-proteobacteria)]|uniref:hypothetical protein n=1 Tax=Bosea sp. (in: a-proteobacteria) TaxID=1871050 RepID=UPI00263728B6|nr:hypothetical protein [Bosea sp. (in: a-proteobacteria)]MCO5090133.1 hypothetical protein [Bosea sp. (in: a-proteobacteria)]